MTMLMAPSCTLLLRSRDSFFVAVGRLDERKDRPRGHRVRAGEGKTQEFIRGRGASRSRATDRRQ
jgi:hypothetical protein